MRTELIGTASRTPMRVREISWAHTYERRMRRFNLEVIFAALIALTLLIAWLFIVEWALFQK
jgi:hypothetical protein